MDKLKRLVNRLKTDAKPKAGETVFQRLTKPETAFLAKDEIINDLSLRLLKYYQVSGEDQILISPYSLISALLALYLASSQGTETLLRRFFGQVTAEELYEQVRQTDQQITGTQQVITSNHILLRADIPTHQSYLDRVQPMFLFETFKPGQTQRTVSYINRLVRAKTKGLIPTILDELSDCDIEVILNVIYFKSHWATKFQRSNTYNKTFKAKVPRTVPMMTQYNETHRYTEIVGCQVLEMDYEGNHFAMGFVLPKKEKELPKLDHKDLHEAINALEETTINKLEIPRFRLEKEMDLEPCLRYHGLDELFSNCDLGRMTDLDGIAVSKVIQKAVIIVDEEGVEAAATTAVVCVRECYRAPSVIINFIADCPFMFYIRHKATGTLLFIGYYQ